MPVKEGEKVSLFASRDASKSHVVLVAINRSPGAEATARIALAGCGRPAKVRSFGYAANSKSLDALEASISADGVSVKLAPFSLAVIDIVLGAAPP